MNRSLPEKDEPWAGTFEGARIANLRAFAKLTPEQKLQWLADMLEFMQIAREARGRREDRRDASHS